MRKVLTSRRLRYGLVAFALVVANPLHLPLTLPWLARQWEGNALGGFVARHEGTILVISTVYFTMAMLSLNLWLFRRWIRPRPPRAAVLPASASNGRHPSQPGTALPYRGPGGGKRPPRPRRRRVRRPSSTS